MNPPELLFHRYLGAFRVGAGGLVIADRCYVDQIKPLLGIHTPARPGTWHGFVRPDPERGERPLALTAAHEAHLDALKQDGPALGFFGVDAGWAAIVDAESLKDPGFVAEIKDAERWEQGLLRDVGCTSPTHSGDGVYNAFGVKSTGGQIVSVRLNLSYDGEYDVFETDAAAQTRAWTENVGGKTELRKYSPQETFAEGETVHHPKLGDGFVARVIEGGKVEIMFREGARTLVHRGK